MICQKFGDKAVLVNFDQKIDPEVNLKVIRLYTQLEKSKVKGIAYFIPAYCSLTIGYDPSLVAYEKMVSLIHSIDLESVEDVFPSKLLEIPVCYHENFAWDMQEVSLQTGLDPDRIVGIHTSIEFQVYMVGFLPGFPYLGRLPETLHCSRKTNPRLKVPALSVAIAGAQAGIYPVASPGGWQIIGRTLLPVFRPWAEEPFLLKAGDKVRFYAITLEEYEFQTSGDF